MKTLLITNALSGFGQAVINLILLLCVVPIFIKELGGQAYGVFALVMVIGNLNTFTNLGLSSALVKFLAEQGKCDESNADIVVCLVVYSLVGITLITGAIYFADYILLRILAVPTSLLHEARILYTWSLYANFMLLVGQIFKSILDSLQKVYITNILQVVYACVYWGSILGILHWHPDLGAVGVGIFVSAFIWLFFSITISVKEYGLFRISRVQPHFVNSLKKQVGYGAQIYVGGVIGFFYEPLSQILISHFIGVAEVGYFDIALRLRNQMWGIISKIFYPLYPFISEQNDHALIRRYINEIGLKMFYMVFPAIAVVVFVTGPFMRVWLGGNHINLIALTAIVITSFHLIGSTQIPTYHFLLAKDLARKTIYAQLCNVAMSVVFFILFVRFAGYYAAIIGNVAGITSSFLLVVFYQRRYLGSTMFHSIGTMCKLMVTFIILLCLGCLIKMEIVMSDISFIIIYPLIACVTCVLFYRVFGLVKKSDIDRYFGTSNFLARILLFVYE